MASAADELGVPTLRTARLDVAADDRIAEWEPDLGVIVAYGGLVREPLLSRPRHGWIDLHFSLLPRWRGAAPVQRALMAGDAEAGLTVFRLVPELDAGDILATRTRPMPEATAGHVLAVLAGEGADLLVRTVDAIGEGTAVAAAQNGEPTYAAKLDDADGVLDWHRPADEVIARFRGVTPEPGAHTTVAGLRLKVLEAAPGPIDAGLAPGGMRGVADGVLVGTATSAIRLVRVQPAGKAGMAAADWWRGGRFVDVVAGS